MATVFDAILSGVSLLFKSCSLASGTHVHFMDVSVLQRGSCLFTSYCVCVTMRLNLFEEKLGPFLLLNKVKDP